MFHFNKNSFILSILLFLLLTYIALMVNDNFIRPFLGDLLVVIWLYLLLNSFINIASNKLAHAVLIFACALEIAQFYNLVVLLGVEHITLLRIILGATFDYLDLLAYSIGWGCILVFIKYQKNRKSEPAC